MDSVATKEGDEVREGGREERRDEGGEKVTLTPNSKHRVIVTASPVY